MPVSEDEENLMAWTKDDEEELQKENDTFVKWYNKKNEENKCHKHTLKLIVYIYQ